MSPTMTTAARDAAGSADILGLSITYRPIHDLVALGRKTRSYTKDQIQKLATSIQTFGFNVPVLIDEEDTRTRSERWNPERDSAVR